MEDTTELLIELIKNGSSESLIHYTAWHFKSALVWVMLGLAAAFCGAFGFKSAEDWEFKLLWVIPVFFGLVILAINIPTVFEPEAYSIHQLIRDVRSQ